MIDSTKESTALATAANYTATALCIALGKTNALLYWPVARRIKVKTPAGAKGCTFGRRLRKTTSHYNTLYS